MTANQHDTFEEFGKLRVVVLYDHRDSGCRAKAFFDQLTNRLEGEVQFSLALWRIDVLQAPGGYNSAAARRDFDGAKMLVLTLQPEGALPGPALKWIEQWAKCTAEGESALVLLQPASNDSATIGSRWSELRPLAQRLRLDLFCEGETQSSVESQVFSRDLQRREQAVTQTMRSILACNE